MGGGGENVHPLICNPRAEVGNYLGIKDEVFRAGFGKWLTFI